MTGPPTYTYTIGGYPASPAAGRITTSRTEILHLALAFSVLTVDLTLIFRFSNLFPGVAFGSATYLLFYGVFGATAALTGFVAHELAHKVSAERRGFWAEFRMSPVGLLLSLVTAFYGFLFAAPGATVIGGMEDKQEWGRTSLAGPLWNLSVGAVFFAAAFVTWRAVASLMLWRTLLLLAFVNGWFATFNLIPLGPLDGAKVWRWSRTTWATILVVAGTLAAAGFIAFNFYPNGAPRL